MLQFETFWSFSAKTDLLNGSARSKLVENNILGTHGPSVVVCTKKLYESIKNRFVQACPTEEFSQSLFPAPHSRGSKVVFGAFPGQTHHLSILDRKWVSRHLFVVSHQGPTGATSFRDHFFLRPVPEFRKLFLVHFLVKHII